MPQKVLVDSSVWIDYLRGTETPQSNRLDAMLGVTPLWIGDLMIVEILQGCTTDRDFNQVRRLLSTLQPVVICDIGIAVAAAKNFRKLRAKGITVRKTIDTLIATRCIVDGFTLLHDDRDFDAFETHLGLRCLRA